MHLADCWSPGRRLARRGLGPKNRVYSRPKMELPDVSQWCAFMAAPARDGGCLATRVEWEQHVREKKEATKEDVRVSASARSSTTQTSFVRVRDQGATCRVLNESR